MNLRPLFVKRGLMLMLLLAQLTKPSLGYDEGSAKLVVGYIRSVTSDHFTLELDRPMDIDHPKGLKMRFMLTRATQIFYREDPIGADGVRSGGHATVRFVSSGDQLLAVEVRLLTLLPQTRSLSATHEGSIMIAKT